MARYYGLRRILSWVAVAFLVGTMLATVYLGWHFAVDDVAGIAIAWVGRPARQAHRHGNHQNPAREPADALESQHAGRVGATGGLR